MEREEAIIGFNRFGLTEGDEIKILKGVTLYAQPVRCEVVKEYDYFIQIKIGFRRKPFEMDKGLQYIPASVNKASLLCGDAIIRCISNGKFLSGTAAGLAAYVKNLEVC